MTEQGEAALAEFGFLPLANPGRTAPGRIADRVRAINGRLLAAIAAGNWFQAADTAAEFRRLTAALDAWDECSTL